MNIKVIVSCHKKDICASNEVYMPIHVGKSLHPDVNLGIQEDNEGDNISNKNTSYCELTGMYWAWKNMKNVDIIGLSHYRRYFDFHGEIKPGLALESFNVNNFDRLDLSIPLSIIDKVQNGSIVVAKPRYYQYNIAGDYCYQHISDDFRILYNIIKETQPKKVIEAFQEVFFKRSYLFHYNMFLMKWEDFNNYCEWLFGILPIVESRTDISNYNSVQKRIYGYMAERLFNVWLLAEKKNLIKKPIIFIDSKDSEESIKSIINGVIWKYRSIIGNYLSYPRSRY